MDADIRGLIPGHCAFMAWSATAAIVTIITRLGCGIRPGPAMSGQESGLAWLWEIK
jgi:hypothetical protein